MHSSRRVRSFALALSGVAVGALLMSPVGAHVTQKVGHLWTDHIRPEVKEDFIAKKSVREASVSCPSTAWLPEKSSTNYFMDGTRRYSTSTPPSVFYCNANLPDGAKVVQVRFSMHDSATPDYVACGLVRTNLFTHNEVDMAGVFTPDASGDSVQDATTIDKPRIDNKSYGYAFRCALLGTTDNTGFYGASATYRIKATTGAAS